MIIRRLFIFAALAVSLSTGVATAQTTRPQLPPEVKNEVNSALSNVLNAIHIFSATDTASSGYYSFDEENDSELEVLRIATDFNLLDCPDAQFMPFLNALAGRVKLTGSFPPEPGAAGVSDFSTFTTWSAGLGLGVNAKFLEHLHIVPKMEFVYSHTSNDFDYNNSFSQTFIQPFDGDVFNWDVDAMSYVPSLKIYYDWQLQDRGVTLIPSVNYSYLYVNSFWTNSELLDVSTSSSVLQSKLQADVPLGVSLMEMPLSAEVFGARYDIYGDAQEAFEFDYYHEVGLGVSTVINGEVPIFSKLGAIASYSFNDDFDGWRVGLQGEL